jgi:hypothetical protein
MPKIARTLDQLYEALCEGASEDDRDEGENEAIWNAAIEELRQWYGEHAVTVMTLFINYEQEAGSCQEQNWGEIKPVLEYLHKIRWNDPK